jgi:hypothetical protein
MTITSSTVERLAENQCYNLLVGFLRAVRAQTPLIEPLIFNVPVPLPFLK